MGYIYTVECFSALKQNDIQLFVATWKDLENTMLSEISQTEKNKHADVAYTSNLIYIYIHTHTHIHTHTYIAKQTHRCRKQTSDYRWGKEGEHWATPAGLQALWLPSLEKEEPGDTDRVVKTCIWSNISEAKGPRATCQRVKQPGQQTGHGRHLCYSGKKAAAIYR